MTLRIQRWYVPAALCLAFVLLACQNRPSSGDRSSAPEAGAPSKTVESESGAAEASGGKAVFPEMDFDFGEVEQGESVTHNFKVRNEGEEVLHIKKVRGS